MNDVEGIEGPISRQFFLSNEEQKKRRNGHEEPVDAMTRPALTVVLRRYGPLCEQCLADRARMTVSQVAKTLEVLRRSVVIQIEHTECPECRQFTQTFGLGKSRPVPDV